MVYYAKKTKVPIIINRSPNETTRSQYFPSKMQRIVNEEDKIYEEYSTGYYNVETTHQLYLIFVNFFVVLQNLLSGNNLNWLLICQTPWTGVKSDLLISVLGKLSWFHLTGPITVVLLIWKWMGLFLRENHLLRCWVWPSLLNRSEVLTLSLLLKLPQKKLKF